MTENGKVTGIVFKKCLSVLDENGRFAPVYDENQTKTVACSHVYLSIGQAIEWGHLLDGSKVELGRGNGAVADSLTYQTAQEDIFVGGDVYTGPKFAIDAIAAGKEGAVSIHRFVQPNTSLTIGVTAGTLLRWIRRISPWPSTIPATARCPAWTRALTKSIPLETHI